MRTSALGMVHHVTQQRPDVLFVSDFVNLAELRALLPPDLRSIPTVSYFHESQLTYPIQEGERRDVHHGMTNMHSVLCADHSLFNSAYHRDHFLGAAKQLLARAPDMDLSVWHDQLVARSSVLGLGTNLPDAAPRALSPGEAPILVWNHRWEYDKSPAAFAAILGELKRRGVPFQLVLLGERFRSTPPALAEIEDRFASQILYSGFAETKAAYAKQLLRGHILLSTARHEFFGLATLEGIRCGLLPVLPDDLAYPELLPEALRGPPFLYPRVGDDDGVLAAADSICSVVELMRGAGLSGRVYALAEFVRQFTWSELAPRFDAIFEAAANAHPNRTSSPRAPRPSLD